MKTSQMNGQRVEKAPQLTHQYVNQSDKSAALYSFLLKNIQRLANCDRRYRQMVTVLLLTQQATILMERLGALAFEAMKAFNEGCSLVDEVVERVEAIEELRSIEAVMMALHQAVALGSFITLVPRFLYSVTVGLRSSSTHRSHRIGLELGAMKHDGLKHSVHFANAVVKTGLVMQWWKLALLGPHALGLSLAYTVIDASIDYSRQRRQWGRCQRQLQQVSVEVKRLEKELIIAPGHSHSQARLQLLYVKQRHLQAQLRYYQHRRRITLGLAVLSCVAVTACCFFPASLAMLPLMAGVQVGVGAIKQWVQQRYLPRYEVSLLCRADQNRLLVQRLQNHVTQQTGRYSKKIQRLIVKAQKNKAGSKSRAAALRRLAFYQQKVQAYADVGQQLKDVIKGSSGQSFSSVEGEQERQLVDQLKQCSRQRCSSSLFFKARSHRELNRVTRSFQSVLVK